MMAVSRLSTLNSSLSTLMSDWYILDPKGLDGPYSLNELRTMLRDGDLSPAEKVQQGKAGTPHVVRDVPELESAASMSPRRREARGSSGSSATVWMIVLGLLALVFVGGGILVLVALLLPAVQQVRTVARRSQSQDNLHNIVIAMHNYEGAYRVLPPGGVFDPDGRAHHGWGTALLPFLEQKPLYDAMDVANSHWEDPTVAPYLSTTIPAFLNPEIAEHYDPLGRGLSHYSANQHVFYENSAIRFADITDGVSNTLGFGEIAGGYPPWASPSNYRDSAKGLGPGADQFGRPDRTGAQFGMLDARVTFLDPSISLDVLEKLGTPADGHAVSVP
jgi:hypothetical protein